jgi:hypothetical protein
MEITFELEDSDIFVEFEPEFNVGINFCDIERVSWKFHNGSHSGIVASMLRCTPEHEYATAYIFPTV